MSYQVSVLDEEEYFSDQVPYIFEGKIWFGFRWFDEFCYYYDPDDKNYHAPWLWGSGVSTDDLEELHSMIYQNYLETVAT